MFSHKQSSFNLPQFSTTGNTIILVLLALLAVAPRLFFIDVPLERDEGVYAYISDVIDRGGIPYRDAFDHKPPLIYYLYNLSFMLFGHSIIAPRITAILFTATACLFAFLIVHHITKNKIAGVLSMAFLGLSSTSPAYSGFDTNTEIFTLPFLVAGSYCALVAGGRAPHFFIAGFLFGLACMTKQVAITIALFALLACVYPIAKNRTLFIKAIFLFCAGLLAPFIYFSVYFSLHDSFSYFWDYFFIYNISYISKATLPNMIELLLYQIRIIGAYDPVIWLSSALCLALFLIYEKSNFYRIFISGLLIGSFIATAMGRYFYGHYFIVMLPFLAITIGVGSNIFPSPNKRAVLQTVLLIGFFIATSIFIPFLKVTHQKLLENLYGENPFYQSVSVGHFLKSTAHPDSTALIIGSEGQILFYAGLPSATSIFYFYPLTLSSSIQNNIKNKFITDIKKNPPHYVLLVNTPRSHFANYSDPLLTEIFKLLANYQPVGLSLFNSNAVIADPKMLTSMLKVIPPHSIVIYAKTTIEK